MRTRMIFTALLLAGSAFSPALAQEDRRDEMRRERRANEDMAQTAETFGQRGGWQRRQEAQQVPQAQPMPAPVAPAQPMPQPNWQPRDNGGNPGGWQRPQPPVMATPVPPSTPEARGGWRDGQGRGWDRGGGNGNTGVVPPPPPQPGVEVRRGNGGGYQSTWNTNPGNRNWDRDGDGRPDWRGRGNDGDRDARPGWGRERDGDHDRDDNRRWNGNRNWNNGGGYRWGGNTNRGWDDRYSDNDRRWNRDWRHDSRYDWQRYRWSNRDIFRQPRYYAPYGHSYGYERFGIGIYLDNVFFGSRYWISDPWQYRLPTASWPYRWVRYYDDVLLVDTRSGYVVDVIYDFFW